MCSHLKRKIMLFTHHHESKKIIHFPSDPLPPPFQTDPSATEENIVKIGQMNRDRIQL